MTPTIRLSTQYYIYGMETPANLVEVALVALQSAYFIEKTCAIGTPAVCNTSTTP